MKYAEKLLEETKEEEKRLTTLINVCLRNKMQNESWVRVSALTFISGGLN